MVKLQLNYVLKYVTVRWGGSVLSILACGEFFITCLQSKKLIPIRHVILFTVWLINLEESVP